MVQYKASRSPCPIGRASRVLGDRWSILILREAFLGANRFDEFIEILGISRASLTSRLAMLVDAGLLRRDPPTGKRALYVLTGAGLDLAPVLKAMSQWSSTHLFPDGAAPQSPWQADLGD